MFKTKNRLLFETLANAEDEEAIRNLMKNLSVTVEQAMELLGIPQNERDKCMKNLVG